MFFLKSNIETLFGLKIYENKVPGLPDLETYNYILKLFVEDCSKKFNEKNICKAISKIKLEWWDKIAPKYSTGELDTVVVYDKKIYSGLTIGNECKVAWRGKIYRSAFFHEILHVIYKELFGVIDPFHLNIPFWKEFEYNINNKLILENI